MSLEAGSEEPQLSRTDQTMRFLYRDVLAHYDQGLIAHLEKTSRAVAALLYANEAGANLDVDVLSTFYPPDTSKNTFNDWGYSRYELRHGIGDWSREDDFGRLLTDREQIIQAAVAEGLAGFDPVEIEFMLAQIDLYYQDEGEDLRGGKKDSPITEGVKILQTTGNNSSIAEALREAAKERGEGKRVCLGLGGVNTDGSWEIRKPVFDAICETENPNDIFILARSILAMDTERSRTVRLILERIVGENSEAIIAEIEKLEKTLTFTPRAELVDPALAASTEEIGIDTAVLEIADLMLRSTSGKEPFVHPDAEVLKRIDELRKFLVEYRAVEGELLASREGIESDHGWEARYRALAGIEFYNDQNLGTYSFKSILEMNRGIAEDSLLPGSDRKAAYNLRRQIDLIVHRTVLEKGLLLSLAGIDTDEAHEIRERFLSMDMVSEDQDMNKAADHVRLLSLVLESLAGCGSQRAWKIRERLAEEAKKLQSPSVAYGLAVSLGGLFDERANKMREDLRPRMGSDYSSASGRHIDVMKGTYGVPSAYGLILSMNSTVLAAIEGARGFNISGEERKITSQRAYRRQAEKLSKAARAEPETVHRDAAADQIVVQRNEGEVGMPSLSQEKGAGFLSQFGKKVSGWVDRLDRFLSGRKN